MADGLFSQAAAAGGGQHRWPPGEQAILFLNRRGFSPLVLCRACGHVLRCTQCAVAMTFHRARDELACHYCGRRRAHAARCARPASCPSWSGWAPAPNGSRAWCASISPPPGWPAWIGTAPAARRGGAWSGCWARCTRGEIDILVGHPDGDQGARLRGGDPGGGAAARPGDAHAGLPRRRADLPAAGAGGGAGRPGRAARAGCWSRPTRPTTRRWRRCRRTTTRASPGRSSRRRQEASYPPFTRLIALRLEGAEAPEVRRAAGEAAARALDGRRLRRSG